MELTEGDDEFWDEVGPDATPYEFAYYSGLLISDPKGRGGLRLAASNAPDFVLTAEFNFGSGEPS